VLFQHDNYGFSAPVVFRSKTQCPSKGIPLSSTATQRRDTTGSARRVSLSTSTDCVVPLAKGTAIACDARLAVNVDKLTELAITMLEEHLCY